MKVVLTNFANWQLQIVAPHNSPVALYECSPSDYNHNAQP